LKTNLISERTISEGDGLHLGRTGIVAGSPPSPCVGEEIGEIGSAGVYFSLGFGLSFLNVTDSDKGL